MQEGEGGVEDSVAHPPGQAEASQLPRASARAALCFLTPGLARAPARFEGVRLKPRERPTPELDTGRGCLDTTGPSRLTCAGSIGPRPSLAGCLCSIPGPPRPPGHPWEGWRPGTKGGRGAWPGGSGDGGCGGTSFSAPHPPPPLSCPRQGLAGGRGVSAHTDCPGRGQALGWTSLSPAQARTPDSGGFWGSLWEGHLPLPRPPLPLPSGNERPGGDCWPARTPWP